MIKKLCIILAGVGLASQANAACVIDLSTPDGGTTPTTLTTAPLNITIDAGAPADTTIFIPGAEANTSAQGTPVTYINCVTGELYGKETTAMLGANLGGGLFATNVDGIAIKPLWNNGGNPAFGKFPSQAPMSFSTPTGRFSYGPNSYFRIELYKTKPTLTLNPGPNQVLPGGIIAYNWVSTTGIANFGQQLQIGAINITSTPSCTFDSNKQVDFQLVTGAKLKAGVDRPLDFDITCITDYGHYSATAAITTSTPSADGNYIKVRDSSGNDDKMQIKISDSTGAQLPLNGSRSEQKVNIASNAPAEFKWTARLEPVSPTVSPSNGNFSAAAEIVLQVN
jgi:type 1 fimbria pilin